MQTEQVSLYRVFQALHIFCLWTEKISEQSADKDSRQGNIMFLGYLGWIQDNFWGVRFDQITVLIVYLQKDRPEQTV